jgi:hypothetical protein
MRTRDGVVDLAEWRAAIPAATALEGLLHDPPWLLGVRLAPAEVVGFELRVTLLWETPQARMCLPSGINDIPVKLIVRNPGASRPVSAPPVP